ncbi:hypothetical protein Taro_023186 [Colocasia esculenta]|uniref:Uncharacterized protein n=1 Tax=Colocasia esculenta TaxID=4460 RepID=A0A843VA49_COLES|nr:hypothetical protein [Colocasia esculenta]
MPVERTDEGGESSRGPSSSSSSPPPPHPPLLLPWTRRGPDPVLVVCRCFSLVTAATALLCVAVNALSAVRSFKDGNDVSIFASFLPGSNSRGPGNFHFARLSIFVCFYLSVCLSICLSAFSRLLFPPKVFDGIFRCYAIVLALFVAVVETEWGFILKFWRVLEYWAGRGMLQIFSLSEKLIPFASFFSVFFSVAVMTRAFPGTTETRKDLILLQQIAGYLLLACGLTYVISVSSSLGFIWASDCLHRNNACWVCYALGSSSVHVNKRKLQESKRLKIWRNSNDVRKSLKLCYWHKMLETSQPCVNWATRETGSPDECREIDWFWLWPTLQMASHPRICCFSRSIPSM